MALTAISAVLVLQTAWPTAAMAEPQWLVCSQKGSSITIRNGSEPDETTPTRETVFVVDREARTLGQYDAGANRLYSWEDPAGDHGENKAISSSVVFSGTALKATLKADFPPGPAQPEGRHIVDIVDIDFTRNSIAERIVQTGTDGSTSRGQYEGSCHPTARPPTYSGEP